jgi:type IV pilus assembly protein PilY1
MKKSTSPLRTLLVAALACAPASPLNAEDIDLFVSGTTASTADNPNVLFIIDNSANWNSNAQHWVGSGGETPFKQGQSELRALKRVIEEATNKVNIGLMMFHAGDPKGTAVRYAVRTMDTTNKTNLAALIGDASCVDGTGANGTPKCIFKNFSGAEQVNTAAPDYSGALFEAFKYFGGCTSPANAQSGVCKTGADLATNKFGVQRYSNAASLSDVTRYDQAAYTDATRNVYVPPAGTANSCAKNYIVFIGNGFPNSDAAASLLAGVEGSTNQLAMPLFNTTSSTTTTTIGTHCGTGNNSSSRLSNCSSTIPSSLTNANPADTYACVGPEELDILACPTGTGANTSRKFNVQATKTVFTVTPTGTSAVPASNKERMADEWARYLFTTDVNGAPGVQNAATYTLDVFKDQQDADQTALLFSMAKYGGGRYFQASSEEAILKALRDIMIEIQSVNTVFASASLPINATNRSQNENQVFIGMFRPDPGARPRWYGNLKRYQIAKFGEDFKLGDASTPVQEAVSVATGFIQPCAVSFWTTDTTTVNTATAPPTDTSYWNFSDPSGTHIGSCTTSANSLFSDSPDGPQVEKGATAQVVRLGNLFTTTPDFLEHRTIYTCSNNGTATSCNTSSAMHAFDNTNVAAAAVGVATNTERDKIINFTRGVDVFDDNSRLSNTDVRPTVHGDVAHSRPLPVNYGSASDSPVPPNPVGVVLYYGANDGAFRAVSGATGKELWSFIAPEHHGKLKRLYHNGDEFGTSLISYPPTPAADSLPKDYFFDGSAGLFQNAANTKIWVFPSMRRGGRMLYGFNVTNPSAPRLLWRLGCSNPSLTDTASCIKADGTAGFAQMGQTWSTPVVARVKGFSTNADRPVVIVGGGYDTCEDQDANPNTACTATGYTRRGNRIYVIDAEFGILLKEFITDGSVPADITVIDRDFDGMVDHAYAADTTGGIYRIDFVDPAAVSTFRVKDDWTITKIGQTDTASGRKFLFSPAALGSQGKVYLALASGDRERPLISNYPFPKTVLLPGVQNRAYMLVDTFAITDTDPPVDMDDTDVMKDFSAGSTCTTDTAEESGKQGWFIDLNAASATVPPTNVGEQGVTSTTIFGGLVFFSTNRPVPTPTGACAQNLGEARGYALNLLNASGAADTLNICGGARSATFIGGGLPPSPVTGTVPVDGQPVTVMIGGVQRGGGASTTIGAQRVTPTITQRRSRIYWYNDADK